MIILRRKAPDLSYRGFLRQIKQILPFCDPLERYKFARGIFCTPRWSWCRFVVDKNLPYFKGSRHTCYTREYFSSCFYYIIHQLH